MDEQIEFSAESNRFEKKSKVRINEMYSNCLDSYRPVIIGYVQCQYSSVQLILKKTDRNTKLRATLGTMNIHRQRSPLNYHK